jgi:hypothetical protein
LLPDGHLIAYPIPGREAGGRLRLTFRRYRNVPAAPELDELMTDRNGIRLIGQLVRLNVLTGGIRSVIVPGFRSSWADVRAESGG